MEARRASAPGGVAWSHEDTIRLGRVAGVRVGLNWSLIAMVALVASGWRTTGSLSTRPATRDSYAVAGGLTAVTAAGRGAPARVGPRRGRPAVRTAGGRDHASRGWAG
jgi:hypothetical protein